VVAAAAAVAVVVVVVVVVVAEVVVAAENKLLHNEIFTIIRAGATRSALWLIFHLHLAIDAREMSIPAQQKDFIFHPSHIAVILISNKGIIC
jgi:hypothetical protein